MRLGRRRARVLRTLACATVAVLLACAGIAQAATDAPAHPSKPLHLIVSFSAGTAVDGLARLVAAKLGDALGQPVTVENRPGAAGHIGTSYAAHAAADGYTLAIVGAGVTINPTLYGKNAVDQVAEFTPVIQLTTQPIVIVANPGLEASSVQELVALARRNPGALAYSTPGVGTPTHIAGSSRPSP